MNSDQVHIEEVAFEEEQEKVLRSISTSRIVLPILIGIGVVGYLVFQQFDPEEFYRIDWTLHTLFWVSMCVFFMAIRHLAYMTRLRILTQGFFSWKKCFELIFIWEFSSAVSPTSVGGSAVALLVLTQERLGSAKTAAIVVYTVVLDSAFFVLTVPLLFMIFGTQMIAPNVTDIYQLGSWGFIFISVYLAMFTYGALFAYGLFISPQKLKQFLMFICRFKPLRRFKQNAEKLGDEVIIASKEIKRQNLRYHLSAFAATAVAWTCRFVLLNCLVVAFVTTLGSDFMTHFLVFSRLESMFVITSFSPTPGGAGFAEYVFGQFLSDFVPATRALTIAIIWRLFTYYFYLLIGVIIIPNWIRNRLNDRRKRKLNTAV